MATNVKGGSKGKMKFWRKTSVKLAGGVRIGRRLRDAMGGQNHPGFLLPIHIWLLRAACISTPIFDKQITPEHTVSVSGTSNAATEMRSDMIEDAEVITHGATA